MGQQPGAAAPKVAEIEGTEAFGRLSPVSGLGCVGFDFRYMVLGMPVLEGHRMTYFQRKRTLLRSDFVSWFFEVHRTVAFSLVGPVIVALLGAFAYVSAVVYLNGQSGVSADTYEVAFVLFLVMGPVPEWLNLIVVALGRTQFRSSIGAGLFGGAAMAFLPTLASLPHENPVMGALMGMIASSIGWWVSISNSAKGLMEQV
ncbi:MAG: hypothetical protein ABI192_13040 [Bradyrhizobium sp.]